MSIRNTEWTISWQHFNFLFVFLAGLMQCNENTAALMASYIVQAECGDYVTEDYPDHTYLSSYKFVPQQDQEMERKIMENHKKHA